MCPGGEVVVHTVGEFLEAAFEREWFPTFTAIERQTVRAAAERSKSEPWVGAVLVGTANDEMTGASRHV